MELRKVYMWVMIEFVGINMILCVNFCVSGFICIRVKNGFIVKKKLNIY